MILEVENKWQVFKNKGLKDIRFEAGRDDVGREETA